MSKAFTKEEDAPESLPLRAAPTSGARRPITRKGLSLLESRASRLEEQRQQARAEPPSVSSASVLKGIDSRLLQLTRILAQVELQPAPSQQTVAAFGSRVRVSQGDAAPVTYRLVGPDEADSREGRISFEAPLAHALLGKKAGDIFWVELPRGETLYTLIEVSSPD